MATWQFDFHLVPATAVERHWPVVPLTISADEYDQLDWWSGTELLAEIRAELSFWLPQGRSWDPERETWGVEDGDRLDVLRDGNRIAELFVRFDVRSLSRPFLSRVVDIAQRRQLLVVTEDRHVLRPSVKELMAAIRRSRSFAYVRDPDGFLNELKRPE